MSNFGDPILGIAFKDPFLMGTVGVVLPGIQSWIGSDFYRGSILPLFYSLFLGIVGSILPGIQSYIGSDFTIVLFYPFSYLEY